ncbi:MAG: methyltransferase FkbM family [Sphingomonas bacterium]|nr:methyltransferase FkbM family [Sphingomonas bacterium]MDB5684292.1 methyltransferase FkbM family [Sphingomonas bacterium]
MRFLRFLHRPEAEWFDLRRLTRPKRQRFQGRIRQLTQFAYLGDGVGLCRVLGRYKLYVDTQDVGVSSHLMLDGYWELWVTEVLVAHLRRGMVAVDVGANLGYFTMVMADLVGASGKVHAFEPNPSVVRHLRRSTHVNGFRERVAIYSDPLGEHDGERVVLDVPDFYPGGTTTVPAPADAEDGVLTMRRMDSYPELADADIIKIDAEGAEQAIWRGMTGIFARRRPMMILLEFVRGRYDDPEGFVDEMIAEGFALNQVTATKSLRPITRREILDLPPEEDIMLILVR